MYEFLSQEPRFLGTFERKKVRREKAAERAEERAYERQQDVYRRNLEQQRYEEKKQEREEQQEKARLKEERNFKREQQKRLKEDEKEQERAKKAEEKLLREQKEADWEHFNELGKGGFYDAAVSFGNSRKEISNTFSGRLDVPFLEKVYTEQSKKKSQQYKTDWMTIEDEKGKQSRWAVGKKPVPIPGKLYERGGTKEEPTEELTKKQMYSTLIEANKALARLSASEAAFIPEVKKDMEKLRKMINMLNKALNIPISGGSTGLGAGQDLGTSIQPAPSYRSNQYKKLTDLF